MQRARRHMNVSSQTPDTRRRRVVCVPEMIRPERLHPAPAGGRPRPRSLAGHSLPLCTPTFSAMLAPPGIHLSTDRSGPSPCQSLRPVQLRKSRDIGDHVNRAQRGVLHGTDDEILGRKPVELYTRFIHGEIIRRDFFKDVFTRSSVRAVAGLLARITMR